MGVAVGLGTAEQRRRHAIHLAVEQFSTVAGIKMNHIPYKGSAPAMTDLLSGQVGIMWDSLTSSLPQARAGKLRALAVSSLKRNANLPDVPTVDETVVKGFQADAWFGLFAPAGTPREIIDLLGREIAAAVRSPDIVEKLNAEAVIAIGGTPAEFAAHIQKEFTRIGNVIRSSGAKFD